MAKKRNKTAGRMTKSNKIAGIPFPEKNAGKVKGKGKNKTLE